ncbi:uncharacterized protein LOC144825247 isoform X3 [Lissotriton helveticus]
METSAAMMILDSFSNLFVEFTLSALLTICLFLEEEIQLTSFNNNMRRKEQSLYTSVETGGLEEAYLCGLEIEMGERSHKPTGVMWTALYCSRCNLMNPPSHSNEEEGTYSRKSDTSRASGGDGANVSGDTACHGISGCEPSDTEGPSDQEGVKSAWGTTSTSYCHPPANP